MPITRQALKRKFVFTDNGQKITLADPNPLMTPDEVLSFYSATYPQLTTSSVGSPTYDGDFAVYTVKTTLGTKG